MFLYVKRKCKQKKNFGVFIYCYKVFEKSQKQTSRGGKFPPDQFPPGEFPPIKLP